MYNANSFRTMPFRGRKGALVIEQSDRDSVAQEYGPLGGLGKLTPAQKAQVKANAQAVSLANKIAKQNAKAAKVADKYALADTKRNAKIALVQAKTDAKLAKYAPTPAPIPDALTTPASSMNPTPMPDYSSLAPASSGGGGGGMMPSIDPATGQPVPVENPLMTYLPYAAGAGLLLWLIMRKKH
jgi:hypothetical protein